MLLLLGYNAGLPQDCSRGICRHRDRLLFSAEIRPKILWEKVLLPDTKLHRSPTPMQETMIPGKKSLFLTLS